MDSLDPYSGDESLIDRGLEMLSEHECLTLAALQPVGRVGITMGALPMVVPVNFCLAGADVVFHTGAGTKLNAAVRGAVVAFEVDDFDPIGHRGWSVLMIGTARELSIDELSTLGPLPVRPWAHGLRNHVVRIQTEFMSGRRIVRSFPATNSDL